MNMQINDWVALSLKFIGMNLFKPSIPRFFVTLYVYIYSLAQPSMSQLVWLFCLFPTEQHHISQTDRPSNIQIKWNIYRERYIGILMFWVLLTCALKIHVNVSFD